MVTTSPPGRFKIANCLIRKGMDKFINYLKDTRAELTHVSWPTQKQTIVYTATVILVSVFVSLFLGVFDFLFSRGLTFFIN